MTANIKRYEGNPVLTPKGQGRDDGNCVSQGAVFRENGLWYMFYSYRNETQNPAGNSAGHLPRWEALDESARSRPPHGGPGATLYRMAPSLQDRQPLRHLVRRLQRRHPVGRGRGDEFQPDERVGRKPPSKLIDQTKWPNYSDETMFHVATPAIYSINNKWYMYFQAARAGEYIIADIGRCGASSAMTW